MLRMYGHWRSQAALRLRIAFALKGIAWAEASIDILGGGQFDPGYTALNPQAMVPTLEHPDGGAPLTQSLAIMEWLEETHPTPPLLPRDPRGRARVRALSLVVAADSHPLVVPGVRARLAEQFGADEAAIGAWSLHFMGRGLRAVEAHLARDPVPGAWCHGDAPGMADICLYGLLAGYAQRGGSLEGMPEVARVGALCEADPRFAAAHPLRQPGAPGRG
jgi:maleylacetoacetate isomerase